MTNNAEHEAFEKWIQTTNGWKACKQRGKPMHLRQNMDGSYNDFRVNDRWFAWKARAQASSVPDGWKLVPEKMTLEMFRAWKKAIRAREQDQDIGMNDVYIAMLAAAPTPPKSASVPVERLEAFISQHGADATHACDEYEVLASLKELIAEYKV